MIFGIQVKHFLRNKLKCIYYSFNAKYVTKPINGLLNAVYKYFIKEYNVNLLNTYIQEFCF